KSTDELWARKNREHKEKNLGWPSCQAIRNEGSPYCEACPHFRNEQTPLHLALYSNHTNEASAPTQQKDDKQAQDGLEARIPAATWAAIKSPHSGVGEFLNIVRTLRSIGFTLDGVTALLERYPDGLAKNCSGAVHPKVEILWGKLNERSKPTSP